MSAPSLPVTAAKAWAAGIGTVLSALTVGLAAVQLAIEDGALSFDEVGSVGLALFTMGSTIYAVWKVPNRPLTQEETGHNEAYGWTPDAP